MPALPKTNTNWRPYQAFAVAASFTQVLPSNVGTIVFQPTGAIAGTNAITLPANTQDGDEVYVVSQYGITGITVSAPSNSSILAGPSALTALTAGVQVGYLKVGNSWLRVQ
jgi:chemotaxis receptor (MCP) glutamine deamidase CheD